MGFSKTDIDPLVPIDVLGTSSMSLTTECSQTLYSSTSEIRLRGKTLIWHGIVQRRLTAQNEHEYFKIERFFDLILNSI